tara:strand:+ start:586 stop:987 length:402 start_codon:yes stop_codon:yes gene_type:complete
LGGLATLVLSFSSERTLSSIRNEDTSGRAQPRRVIFSIDLRGVCSLLSGPFGVVEPPLRGVRRTLRLLLALDTVGARYDGTGEESTVQASRRPLFRGVAICAVLAHAVLPLARTLNVKPHLVRKILCGGKKLY